jgi:transposase, IS6 family
MQTNKKLKENPFLWKHYEGEIILLNVRWYCSYGLSYRNLVEMMEERGLDLAHTTIMRWVHEYAPQIDKKIRPHLKRTCDSWRVDETYIKVNGKWTYLYRAVDKEGNTLDFLLRAKRDAKAASRFFKKVLKAKHTQTPRVINVDKNPALSCSLEQLKKEGLLPKKMQIRPVKYLNNIIEQDHRFIKKVTKPCLGFKSLRTASKTIAGIEAMHTLWKGQMRRCFSAGLSRAQIVNKLFGFTA